MPWFKVDDGFWSHPKVIDLSPSAGWLWLRAGSYSAQHLTDGVIKTATLRMLGANVDDAEELVKAGLWDGKTDGYEFHDWARYQPPASASKQKRDELSQKRAESGRKGAQNRWHPEQQENGNGDGKLLSESDGNEIAPSRPVPTQEVSKETSTRRKKPETTIPDDWKPNEKHYTKGNELRVNVDVEAERFRNHAESKDRRAVRWDAAFSNWLLNATPSIAPAQPRSRTVDELVADRARFAAEDEARWRAANGEADHG